MRLIVALLALVALAGCEQTFRNMYDQPRYKPLAASPLWSDTRASRPRVAGTIPHAVGTFAGSTNIGTFEEPIAEGGPQVFVIGGPMPIALPLETAAAYA